MKIKKRLCKYFMLLICLIGIRVVNAEGYTNLMGTYTFTTGNINGSIVITEKGMQINSWQNVRGEWREYEKTTGSVLLTGNILTYTRNCENNACTNELGVQFEATETFSFYDTAGQEKLVFDNEYSFNKNLEATKIYDLDPEKVAYFGDFWTKLTETLEKVYSLAKGISIDYEAGSSSNVIYRDINIRKDGELFHTISIKYIDGILNYTMNENYFDENGNVIEIDKANFDQYMIMYFMSAIADMKGYDKVNFGNWLKSFSLENFQSMNLEEDGISFKFQEVPENDKGISGYYTKELNVDLVNGIKAYDPNVTYIPIEDDNIFNEIEKNEDKIENSTKQPENLSNKDNNDLPDNPGTGSFISIVLLIIATTVSGVFYFISKKKSKLYKI